MMLQDARPPLGLDFTTKVLLREQRRFGLLNSGWGI